MLLVYIKYFSMTELSLAGKADIMHQPQICLGEKVPLLCCTKRHSSTFSTDSSMMDCVQREVLRMVEMFVVTKTVSFNIH